MICHTLLFKGFEEQVTKLKSEVDKYKNENSDMTSALAEEQRKSIHLTSELSNNSSSKQALLEAEEKLRDLQKENSILRESNAKLLGKNQWLSLRFSAHIQGSSLQIQLTMLNVRGNLQLRKMHSKFKLPNWKPP